MCTQNGSLANTEMLERFSYDHRLYIFLFVFSVSSIDSGLMLVTFTTFAALESIRGVRHSLGFK